MKRRWWFGVDASRFSHFSNGRDVSEDVMYKNSVFKVCPACGYEWDSREKFLQDATIEIIGYQANFENLELGLFFFNHACKGTMAIRAGAFEDLYEGPVFKERVTGSEDCRGYCFEKDELRLCPAKCECSYVREIIQLLKRTPPSSESNSRNDP